MGGHDGAGLTSGTALVLTFDHVLADGIGGLAVLARLVDGAPPPAPAPFPRPRPTRRQLAAEATRSRLRGLVGPRMRLGRLSPAGAQLRPGLRSRAPRCSLNRPTGPRRRLAVARTDLATLRSVAHAAGATVNDAVLTAVAGALRAFLAARRERLDEVVVSVPVSGRAAGEADPVGNRTGVVPVRIPAAGDAVVRLEATARVTGVAKSGARGATAALLEPVFRALAVLGVMRWYIRRQQRVNTFVTNLRGPPERQFLLGAPVTDPFVISGAAGNVAVAFGALSYAGTLTVTVVADPDVCPDVASLAARLQEALDHLVGRHQPAAAGHPRPPVGFQEEAGGAGR